MIEGTIRERIEQELSRIEREERIAIFYACESGSRAWGFESEDSDYDVRFLYTRPPEWYISIAKRRDVVERPIDDELDINGWDLPKALGLLRKSNPPLLEWLQSPIIYRQDTQATDLLRGAMEDCCSPRSCLFHYARMARGNHREFLQGEEVWVKKYLYVLRPVLACLWIERGMGLVPMEFAKLVDGVVDDLELRVSIDGLLERKRAGKELDRGPRIPAISAFIDRELARLDESSADPAPQAEPERLDKVLHEVIRHSWGTEFAPPSRRWG